MTNEVTPPTQSAPQIPESNKTSLGLYVMPTEAYAMWKSDPEKVHILDVRTFEEYTFVGHLEMAKNIPLLFPKYDPKGPSLPGRPPGCYGELNPDFIPVVKEQFALTDTILVYCATGGRAAMAVNALAQAGFTTVYNIVNGLEGDRIDDPGSVFHGKHMRNGWKNSGLPWGYGFHPDLMWVDPTP
jgi:rhodanese-related sulfurtransferase